MLYQAWRFKEQSEMYLYLYYTFECLCDLLCESMYFSTLLCIVLQADNLHTSRRNIRDVYDMYVPAPLLAVQLSMCI